MGNFVFGLKTKDFTRPKATKLKLLKMLMKKKNLLYFIFFKHINSVLFIIFIKEKWKTKPYYGIFYVPIILKNI